MDYEVCLHTNSVYFTKKTSSVRRRYSEFVWLRQKLQEHSLLMVQLPELPPKNPFFSLNNAQQITERMKGLQKFLEKILQSPFLMSDSCLHLFLQSQLSVSNIEACVAGRTPFSVVQAVRRSGLRRFHSEEDLQKDLCMSCDSDSDSSECRNPEKGIKGLSADKSKRTASLDIASTTQDKMLGSSSGSA
ncbi:unnamed protein product [Menidia menidia]|nr:unnamed protein product [Menidia menidia]